MFRWCDKWLLRALMFMTGLSFSMVVISVILGVFYRYILKSPLSWVEEFSRLNFIWSTFIGACVAARRKEHIKVTIFSDKLSVKSRAVHNVIIYILSLIFVVTVLLYSRPVYEAMSMQIYAGMPFSQKWQVMPIIISMVVMGIYFVLHTIMGLKIVFQKEGKA